MREYVLTATAIVALVALVFLAASSADATKCGQGNTNKNGKSCQAVAFYNTSVDAPVSYWLNLANTLSPNTGWLHMAGSHIQSNSNWIGKNLNEIDFYAAKYNNATGMVVVGVMDANANVISSFCTFDASILTSSPLPTQSATNFEKLSCTGNHILQANEVIGIKYLGGDTQNYIMVQMSNTPAPINTDVIEVVDGNTFYESSQAMTGTYYSN